MEVSPFYFSTRALKLLESNITVYLRIPCSTIYPIKQRSGISQTEVEGGPNANGVEGRQIIKLREIWQRWATRNSSGFGGTMEAMSLPQKMVMKMVTEYGRTQLVFVDPPFFLPLDVYYS